MAFTSEYLKEASWLSLIAGGGLVFGWSTAVAQTSDGARKRIEEITVTARRREELLLDVPEQVTVFTSDEIVDAQITSYEDFAALTPNLQVFENFRRGVFNITMRGIPTVQGGEPPATILVDGVQASSLEFINHDLFDIASIQVLRGPQGAVYGRGAIAGAILIETKQPTEEFSADAAATYTNEIDQWQLRGAVSGPILDDKLLYRLSAGWTDREGFLSNPLLGGTCDFVDEKMVRGQLSYQPSEVISIRAQGRYINGRNGAGCYTFSSDTDPFLNEGEDFPDEIPRDFQQYDDRELMRGSVLIDWDVPGGTVVSATSYQRSDSFSPGDTDFSAAIVPVFFANPVTVEAVNQDLHYSSESAGPFQWLVGAFAQRRETENRLRVHTVPPLPPATLLDSRQEDLSAAWAVYAGGTYRPGDSWELGLSLRYDRDHRESEDVNVPGSYIESTFSSFQPQASLTYFLPDDWMVYASAGRGFRSGGFNALADTVAVGLPDREYPKETATNYEVGFKGETWDGRLRLSGAFFKIDFENQQFFFVDTANFARIVLTFPETEILGAELEAAALLLPDLEVRLAYGLADGEIKDGGASGTLVGKTSPNAHEYTFSASLQYERELTTDLRARVRLDYERRGPIYYDQLNQYRFPETDFLDLALGVSGEHWTVTAFIKNATDERIPTFFGVNAFGEGAHSLLQNLPRRYGLEVRWSY